MFDNLMILIMWRVCDSGDSVRCAMLFEVSIRDTDIKYILVADFGCFRCLRAVNHKLYVSHHTYSSSTGR